MAVVGMESESEESMPESEGAEGPEGPGGTVYDMEMTSIDMESTYLSRTGRQPSNEEVIDYLERHQLQTFLTEVIMYVARHIPPDPFEFLLDHLDALVTKHRSQHGLAPRRPAFEESEPTEQSSARRLKVVRHLATALQNEDTAGASAAKLFDQYAERGEDDPSPKLSELRFNDLTMRLQDIWGMRSTDVRMMLQTLQRWRFQKSAASQNKGGDMWPMSREDFVEAFPSMLRRVRDDYVPIGGRLHRSLFIRRASGLLTDRYAIGSRLGRGAFGEVFTVSLKADRADRRVCKRVARTQQRVPCEDMQGEVRLLRSLDHPHIIRLFEYFESEDWLDMIMEPVFGGTLSRLITGLYMDSEANVLDARLDSLSERWMATLVSQLLGALVYAHEAGVIHKDLKPDNVLLVGKPGSSVEKQLAEPLHVMLADFGIAELFSERSEDSAEEAMAQMLAPSLGGATRSSMCTRREMRSTRVGGTPSYMSPEMFSGSFTEKCDIWSLGVIVFQLLSGELPYRADNLLMQANLVCNPRRHPQWHRLAKLQWSLGLRWFCQQLLQKDEKQRPSAADAAKDPWITTALPLDAVQPSVKERSALNQQHLQSHLMKMAMAAMTSQLNLSKLHQLNLAFTSYDRSGDGRLSHEEMREVLQGVGVPGGEDMELVIEALDGDRSGCIEYSEFMAGSLDLASQGVREHMRAAFELFDLDGSGSLTISELARVLTEVPDGASPRSRTPTLTGCDAIMPAGVGSGLVLPDGKTVEEVMRWLDADSTGKVTFEEFEIYLLREHEKIGQDLYRKQRLLKKGPGATGR